jgi:phasin family protein
LTTFERSFDAAGQGAAAFNRKIVDIVRRNVDASFDLATSLAGAKNLADIVELQSAFWRKQFGVLTAQAEEVHALSTKVTADAAEQIKSQMARGGVGTVKAH